MDKCLTDLMNLVMDSWLYFLANLTAFKFFLFPNTARSIFTFRFMIVLFAVVRGLVHLRTGLIAGHFSGCVYIALTNGGVLCSRRLGKLFNVFITF